MQNPFSADTVVARPNDAQGFKPYVPDDVTLAEFTMQSLVAGTLLGIVFGASSLYLVLKTGITVSASIPVAVLSITIFRAFSKMFGTRVPTILENNIAQTAGSAGESIAFGVGVTMPVMLLLGFDMEVPRVMLVSVLGGTLGILMMIPLRRAFIVKLHGKAGEPGKLLYPEGTACAEVLISGEKGGASGGMIFLGFLLAFAHKFSISGLNLFQETAEATMGHFAKSYKWIENLTQVPSLKQISRVGAVNCSMAPELLGVGFIIGPRTASIMMAGAVLGYLLIVPMIALFGAGLTASLPPADKLIADMSASEISRNYLRFIGAGCVTAAGIISMVRTLPMIVRSIGAGVGNLGGAVSGSQRRTERDLPMGVVFIGSFALLGVMAAFLTPEVGLNTALLGAGLILIFGFLFVTVSSRLTGEIGSTSNPISGMTVATLSLTCLIFVLMGKTSPTERVLALSIAAVVCIAASNGGTTSQDLKTGFLVGGTPILQQWAILIGATVSALFIGVTLLLFNQAGTIYSSKPENLPKVTLTKEQLAKLTSTETYQGASYKVWRPNKETDPGVQTGKYLVDDNGKVAWLVDPAITGRLTNKDDGEKVTMKFEAPKTQVMGLIINGVLGGTLNWGLVILGAMIAVTLELCGVSSLAFAVGVYIPMADTAPIFLGGLCRWLIDRKSAPAKGESEVEQIAKTETSSGVLLSSGFVAGGTIAAVICAFLQFDVAETLRKKLNLGALNPANISEPLPRFDGSGTTFLAFLPLIVLLILISRYYNPKSEPNKS